MLTIGLTGGIGSGKSTVAHMLSELGALVWDADVIGHSVYEPGMPAYDDLVAAFGKAIVGADDKIDRKALGRIVFADAADLKRLNAIVHPRIFERMAAMVSEARGAGERRPIVIEAAILIEAGWQKLFDEIWLVVTSHERVIERVERYRKMTREQIEARIRAQLSEAERQKWARLVIRNDGTLDDLRSRTAAVFEQALARSAEARG
ncbi:MAG TPA: dephospho-CoA kinase [Candidatus Binataceae bacterium]|nr:dephospho-CoA kinase [Candidatus Binataceae bacterium]